MKISKNTKHIFQVREIFVINNFQGNLQTNFCYHFNFEKHSIQISKLNEMKAQRLKVNPSTCSAQKQIQVDSKRENMR